MTTLAVDEGISGAANPQSASEIGLPGSGSVGPRGQFSYGVPMVVAPGRAGLTPSVGLSYSSGKSADANIAGYGWGVPMSAITRSTRYGVNEAYFRNEFNAPGEGELVDVSTNGFTDQPYGWGATDPVPADYDADGKADLAVVHRTNYNWYIFNSGSGVQVTQQWGAVMYGVGDKYVPADYDGDGKADIAVYRGLNNVFYVLKSSNGQMATNDMGAYWFSKPVPADYDNDGKADYAIVD